MKFIITNKPELALRSGKLQVYCCNPGCLKDMRVRTVYGSERAFQCDGCGMDIIIPQTARIRGHYSNLGSYLYDGVSVGLGIPVHESNMAMNVRAEYGARDSLMIRVPQHIFDLSNETYLKLW